MTFHEYLRARGYSDEEAAGIVRHGDNIYDDDADDCDDVAKAHRLQQEYWDDI